jgi:hypothetical protein
MIQTISTDDIDNISFDYRRNVSGECLTIGDIGGETATETGDYYNSKVFQMMVSNDVIIQINTIIQNYYSFNNKAKFIKNDQKLDCAKYVYKYISNDVLLSNTFYTNGNNIYVNYVIFKLFVHPEIFDQTFDYLLSLIVDAVSNYGDFKLHFNLKGFTISSADRYKTFITKLLNLDFINVLNKIYIYNSPSVVDFLKNIFKNLINYDSFKDKVVIVN